MHMLTVKPLRLLTLYGLGHISDITHVMLDILQQNPLKYGFSGIEDSLNVPSKIQHHGTHCKQSLQEK